MLQQFCKRVNLEPSSNKVLNRKPENCFSKVLL